MDSRLNKKLESLEPMSREETLDWGKDHGQEFADRTNGMSKSHKPTLLNGAE